MIISFNGDEGSGKSTIAEKIASCLKFPHYNMGQFYRDLAAERGITLAELQEIAKKGPEIDNKVENSVLDLGKNQDNFVIESRTAWHFIPHSIKIYLKVDEEEGAKRIFQGKQNSNTRNNEDTNLNSVENIITSERSRKERDTKRYKDYYGIDIRDERNYDFVLDTTNLSIDQVVEKVRAFIDSKVNR